MPATRLPSLPQRSPTWHGEARRLSSQGVSQREIARRFNRSVGAVHKALNPEKYEQRRTRGRRNISTIQEADPGIPGLIPVYHKGRIVDFARVDIGRWDELREHHLYLRAKGYAGFSREGRQVYLHHEVLGQYLTRESGLNTDHINRDPLDNRANNLRIVTTQENLANRGGQFERDAA